MNFEEEKRLIEEQKPEEQKPSVPKREPAQKPVSSVPNPKPKAEFGWNQIDGADFHIDGEIISLVLGDNGAKITFGKDDPIPVKKSDIKAIMEQYKEEDFRKNYFKKFALALPKTLDNNRMQTALESIDPMIIACAYEMSKIDGDNDRARNLITKQALMQYETIGSEGKKTILDSQDFNLGVIYDIEGLAKSETLLSRITKNCFSIKDKKQIAERAKEAEELGIALINPQKDKNGNAIDGFKPSRQDRFWSTILDKEYREERKQAKFNVQKEPERIEAAKEGNKNPWEVDNKIKENVVKVGKAAGEAQHKDKDARVGTEWQSYIDSQENEKVN